MEDHVEMEHAVADQDMLEIIVKNLFARKLVKMEVDALVQIDVLVFMGILVDIVKLTTGMQPQKK